jgi:hypothetical protein
MKVHAIVSDGAISTSQDVWVRVGDVNEAPVIRDHVLTFSGGTYSDYAWVPDLTRPLFIIHDNSESGGADRTVSLDQIPAGSVVTFVSPSAGYEIPWSSSAAALGLTLNIISPNSFDSSFSNVSFSGYATHWAPTTYVEDGIRVHNPNGLTINSHDNFNWMHVGPALNWSAANNPDGFYHDPNTAYTIERADDPNGVFDLHTISQVGYNGGVQFDFSAGASQSHQHFGSGPATYDDHIFHTTQVAAFSQGTGGAYDFTGFHLLF